MPTYVYKCKNCSHELEIIQSMSATPLRKCPECKKNKLEKILFPCYGFVKNGITDWKTLGDLAKANREKMSDDEYKEATKRTRASDKMLNGKKPIELPEHKPLDRTLLNMTPEQQKDYIERGVKPTPSDEHSLGMSSLTGVKKKPPRKRRRKKG